MNMDAEEIAGPDILKEWVGKSRVYDRAIDAGLQQEVQQFVFREARLQDIHDYDGWEGTLDR
ncbi:hypothetical protein N4R57_11720 [Rhodobacteraceae bacterium D3-12]|nr:hypothetical protein N4R57_11720 [Rhodobacteraceae bacterium D3-12]